MAKTTRRAPISINIVPAGEGAPANKLADAELLFHEGPLAGLKLAGFAVWTRKDGGHNITVPSRPYVTHGEKKSFALLRPVSDMTALESVRTLILAAYQARAANGDIDD